MAYIEIFNASQHVHLSNSSGNTTISRHSMHAFTPFSKQMTEEDKEENMIQLVCKLKISMKFNFIDALIIFSQI
jgi:hypothetical protein